MMALLMGRRSVLLVGVLASLSACAGGDDAPSTLRLVDMFQTATLEDSASAPTVAASRTEWTFDEPGGSQWEAGPGVTSLAAGDGRLRGRTTKDFPIVHVERKTGLDSVDVLHSVEVRARASKGTNLSMTVIGTEEIDFDGIIGRSAVIPWPLRTPIVGGNELQTYTMTTGTAAFRTSFPASDIRYILLRPTDASGADFEIEWVRLIFRGEHLASIPSGVSWQGFGDVFRETIVTRAPERAKFTLSLPLQPALDLAVGTVEDGPVTFRVEISQGGQDGGATTVFERTVTTPDRWEPAFVDLGDYAGQTVTLSLGLDAGQDGTLGFWGAPAVRDRAGLPPATNGAPRPQGVVYVFVDTLRSDHLDAYGYERETAPAVTRLAAEGTLFRDNIAQGAWTKVSAPSMYTSFYPTALGIVDIADRVPSAAVTMAEAYREAGYATWATSSVPFTGRTANMHQGLEVLHERGSFDPPEGQNGSKTAREFVDRLLPWLEAHRDVPFFVLLHVTDPHDEYEPYRPYESMWAAPGAKAEHEALVEKVREFIKDPPLKRRGLPTRSELMKAGVDPEAFVRTELDWYDGSIRGSDAELERVMEKLRELGLDEKTLVVFISDHGEEFLDHDEHFHEMDVYGEMINAPLIMRWPGVIPAGAVIEETVQNVDVMPTLLELSGIPLPEGIHGRSLVPLMTAHGGMAGFSSDARWQKRPAVSEWERRKDQLETRDVDAFSIILDGWKLIHNVERPQDYPEFELYHHANDPLDQKDLASDNQEIVERLAKQLERWHEWALAARLPSDAEATEDLPAEELERLRSLGYVQ